MYKAIIKYKNKESIVEIKDIYHFDEIVRDDYFKITFTIILNNYDIQSHFDMLQEYNEKLIFNEDIEYISILNKHNIEFLRYTQFNRLKDILLFSQEQDDSVLKCLIEFICSSKIHNDIQEE